MHEIMVKYLPRQCRLIAMFDVSHLNNIHNMAHEHTDVFAVLPFWDCSGSSLYCMQTSFPDAPSRLPHFTQYDSDGKQCTHPDKLRFLREKESHAHVVSSILPILT